MKQNIRFIVVVSVIVVLVGILAVRERLRTRDIVFAEALDEVVAVIDGQKLTLRDVAFYIAYEEGQMEWEARLYDPKDTGAFWRIYTNHTFIWDEGKNTALNMAVHDAIFYQMAIEQGLSLTEEEELLLANDRYDFWSDLEDWQRERLGVSEETLGESMRRLALAEKYQYLLSDMKDAEFASYSFNGAAYERLLESHECEIEDSLWERVPFGSITVDH